MCHSMLQCVAVCRSVLQHAEMISTSKSEREREREREKERGEGGAVAVVAAAVAVAIISETCSLNILVDDDDNVELNWTDLSGLT